MQKFEIIGSDGEIVLETTLTNGQISKFNSLASNIIVEGGAAYIPIDKLHGVLLTNSRQRAIAIVNNHKDIVKAYLVRDPIRFEKYGVSATIKPMGLYALLETLAEDNPKRASDYRASLALLSYIIAKNPQLALSSNIKAKHQEALKNSVIGKLKRQNSICLLCEEPFTDEDEKHAHHIEGESEDPSLATDQDNLILVKGWIHVDYHNWLNEIGLPINRESLKNYAMMKNFSLTAL
jgi:hypothetical protein